MLPHHSEEHSPASTLTTDSWPVGLRHGLLLFEPVRLWHFVTVAPANAYTVQYLLTFTILATSKKYYKTEDGQKVFSYQCLSRSPPTDFMEQCAGQAPDTLQEVLENLLLGRQRLPLAVLMSESPCCSLNRSDGCSKTYNVI